MTVSSPIRIDRRIDQPAPIETKAGVSSAVRGAGARSSSKAHFDPAASAKPVCVSVEVGSNPRE